MTSLPTYTVTELDVEHIELIAPSSMTLELDDLAARIEEQGLRIAAFTQRLY